MMSPRSSVRAMAECEVVRAKARERASFTRRSRNPSQPMAAAKRITVGSLTSEARASAPSVISERGLGGREDRLGHAAVGLPQVGQAPRDHLEEVILDRRGPWVGSIPVLSVHDDPQRLARDRAEDTRRCGGRGRAVDLARIAGVEGEHAEMMRDEEGRFGRAGQVDGFAEGEVARDAGGEARGVAAVDGQERDVGAKRAHGLGQAVERDAVARMVERDVAGGDAVAEEDVAPLRVRLPRLVGGGEDADPQAREGRQDIARVGEDQAGGRADARTRHLLPRGGHDEGETGEPRREGGERVGVHVVGVRVGHEHEVGARQVGGQGGRRHHPAVVVRLRLHTSGQGCPTGRGRSGGDPAPVSIQKPACPSHARPGCPGAGHPGTRSIRMVAGHGIRPVTRAAMAAISSKAGPRTGIGHVEHLGDHLRPAVDEVGPAVLHLQRPRGRPAPAPGRGRRGRRGS